MNFKKPLSLLLLAGIATAQMSIASDQTAQEKINDRYHRRIQDDMSDSRSSFYPFSLFVLSFYTSLKYLYYFDIVDKIKHLQKFHQSYPKFSVVNEITNLIKERDTVKISLIIPTVLTLYFGIRTIAQMINLKNAEAELEEFGKLKAEIESNQT